MAHLIELHRMFRELDCFVFALGRTEAWRRRDDGAILPLAPAVVAGQFDPAAYDFANVTMQEVASDLCGFLQRLRSVNPGGLVLPTVSPVSLIATFKSRHVLVSTVACKSVLRAVGQVLVDRFNHVDYFPNYEIVTSQANQGHCFEPDLRSVAAEGVEHVMRVFLAQHGGCRTDWPAPRPVLVEDTLRADRKRRLFDLVCEEESRDLPGHGAAQ